VFQHETRSATVTIWEKESRRPLKGVAVQVRYVYDGYQYIYVHNRPSDADGVTDEDGRVVLPVADFKYGTIFKADYARVQLSPEQVRAGGSFIMDNVGTLNAEKPTLQLGLERPLK
jgi:hypothetical protein